MSDPDATNPVFYRIPRIFFWWRRAITLWFPWRKEARRYLPWSYQDGKLIAITLVHEGIHCPQWESGGLTAPERQAIAWTDQTKTKWARIKFLWRYAHKRGRLELEAEAFAGSVRCARSLGVLVGGMEPLTYYARGLATEYAGLANVDTKAAIERYLLPPLP